MSGSGCSTALLVGLWAAQAVGCPWMWMRQLQELYFYIFLCTALFWHRSGRAAPAYVCVCAPVFTIHIHMYIHAYLDPATWTAGCALCAVASAVKLCVSNVLCLQQSFIPSPLRLLCCLCIDLHTHTDSGTRGKSLKQANGNGSGLHVMLVEVPAVVSLLFYHKHLRPDLT